MKYISDAPNAPKAVGPYSQAVDDGHTVYLAGQVGIDPSVGKLVDGGIEPQANQVLKNLKAVLNHCGLDFTNVVKTTILLKDMAHYQMVNAIYAEWLGAAKPARATYQVAGLPLGAEIEIEMIAVR